MADVQALGQLLCATEGATNPDVLLKNSYTVSSARDRYEFLRQVADRLVGLKRNLVSAMVVTLSMARKIPESGLVYRHLSLTFRRKQVDGLTSLLSEVTVNGKARVTKSIHIINALCEHFQQSE